MEKNTKINTDTTEVVCLISKEDVEIEFGEAAASVIGVDEVITWAKFTLTDDKPDANGQRVPAEEFDNLIRTGLHKPVKMAIGEIKDGHEDAHPLGTITNLTRQGNKIVALAALWNRERNDDIATVKDRVNSGKPVNVSWEILYGARRFKDGVEDLLDTVLRAVTIVGMPAYKGRTQFLAVAAKKWSPAYIEKLPDTSFLHVGNDGTRYFAYRDDSGKIDPSRFNTILEEVSNTSLPENTLKSVRHQVTKLKTMISADASIRELLEIEDFITEEDNVDIKELETKVSELEGKLAVASEKLVEKETQLTSTQEQFNLADTNLKTLEEEVKPLREFKEEADKASQRAEKLSAIKAKFEGLKREKSEEYFNENADKLLGLDESGLDFMLQEMVAFKEEGAKGEGEASVKKTSGIPNVPGEGGLITDPKELGKAYRELRASKK